MITSAQKMLMARAGVPTGGGDVWTDPDLANASYDSVSFSVATEDTQPQELFFKPDGTKVYVVGASSDSVIEYDLSTAWDISTASYLQNFSVASQETAPRGLFFKPDGAKMYVLGDSGNDLNEYDLSTAWDVSSASYLQNFSIGAEETIPQGLSFKPDGTKMYVTGSSGQDINEYDLSTAWDISTASFLQNFSVSAQSTLPQDLFFNPNGNKMYIIDRLNRNVLEYSLSSAWDISSSSYVQAFDTGSQEQTPTSLYFKSDGSKMYVLGNQNDTIYQYSTD